MKNDFNRLDHALSYAKIGWAVFPCHSIIKGKCTCNDENCSKPGKHPLTPNGFKDASKDENVIRNYWAVYPYANIGCATGKISGILVLDLDIKHGRSSKEFNIPPTVCTKTGGGGEHFFFKYTDGDIQCGNGKLFGLGVDIKADGGYVILAPSNHISGKTYEWNVPPEDEELAEIPSWLIEAQEKYNNQRTNKLWKKNPADVFEGNRNDTAASMAGKIQYELPENSRETVGWPRLVNWNKNIKPPLSEKELRAVWESVKKYEKDTTKNKDERKRSQADILLEIIEGKENVVLFHDEIGDSYISLENNNHMELWGCKTKFVKRWLTNEFWNQMGTAPVSEVLKNVIGVLEGRATFAGHLHKLNNRFAWHDGDLWYDLTNEDWQAIKINELGWKIVDSPPIIFKRYPHNRSQIKPIEKGGDLSILLNYINITDPQHKLLLLVFLVSCFIPDFGHPILVIFGSQGSAKTTALKLFRLIVDPSIIDVASMPDNSKELIQSLAHHAVLFFDNVSYISETTSDILCKAITGTGFIKRELYTDDEDIVYTLKRCIGINGINLVGTRPDLLERSLILELNRIDPKNRKQEKELMENFEKDLPVILGGVFDVIVKALKIKSSIEVPNLPRMADFAVWGSAIAVAMGYTQNEFMEAYRSNISRQTETLLNENIIAAAIISFMETRDKWVGTATKLLRELNDLDFEDDTYTKDKNWPKASNVLMRRLNELKVNLQEIGISYLIVPGNTREITITKIAKEINTNDADDISQKLSEDIF